MKTKSELNKSGIYKIVNKLNGKLYIGSSNNIRKRWKAHRNRLRNSNHTNKYLQSTYNKYGINALIFEVIEFVNLQNLIIKEQFWIDYYESYNRKFGFNLSPIANSPNFGRKASQKTIKKLRMSHIGNRHSIETKKKISESQFKPVYQIDINGNIVKKFSSCLDVENQTGISKQNISMACRSKTNYISGYQWCYVEHINKFISKLPKGWKPVAQINDDGNIIKQWKSIDLAAKDNNISRSTMCRKLKDGKEFKFVYTILR